MSKIDLASILIRGPQADDAPFILATWLRGLYYGCDWYKAVPKDIFMAEYHKILVRLLSAPGVEVQVACLKDDPSVILGYSVLGRDKSVIHWAFVKTGWREMGLARILTPASVTSASHLTKVGMNILRKHSTIVFNPFLGV